MEATGGPVEGAFDPRCEGRAQPIDLAVCGAAPTLAPALRPLHTKHDGGAYGNTQYNADGTDDDCKYRVQFTTTPVRRAAGVTFTVSLTAATSGKPVAGADPFIEAYLDGEIAGLAEQVTEENAPGQYTIGPVTFDRPGTWTVRFHFFGACEATGNALAPVGHAAFYLRVP